MYMLAVNPPASHSDNSIIPCVQVAFQSDGCNSQTQTRKGYQYAVQHCAALPVPDSSPPDAVGSADHWRRSAEVFPDPWRFRVWRLAEVGEEQGSVPDFDA